MQKGTTRHLLQRYCLVAPLRQQKSLESYIQLSRELLMQANSYYSLGSYEQAYIFFKRYLSLVINELPKHNDYSSSYYAHEVQRTKDYAKNALDKLEIVSARLDEFDVPIVEHDVEPNSSLKRPCHEQNISNTVNPCAVHDASQMSLKQIFDDLSPDTAESYKISYPSIDSTKLSYISSTVGGRIKGDKCRDICKLRSLILPGCLAKKFEIISRPNSMKEPNGIETCGILAGHVVDGSTLSVTHLIVPEQSGTSDSCTATDEVVVFEYMRKSKLITLGWIHTHPRQSCFMSSIDLHTHCAYQTMLPEAVAVVLAPTDQDKTIGVFRLEAPHGLRLIQECKMTGFHPHPDNIKIYSDADIRWDSSSLQIVDLRHNK